MKARCPESADQDGVGVLTCGEGPSDHGLFCGGDVYQDKKKLRMVQPCPSTVIMLLSIVLFCFVFLKRIILQFSSLPALRVCAGLNVHEKSLGVRSLGEAGSWEYFKAGTMSFAPVFLCVAVLWAESNR